MANEVHLLLTAIGGYSATATQFTEETWQIGIRHALVFSGSVDPVAPLPTNVHITAAAINRNETNWTIVGNWLADNGSTTQFHGDDYLNDVAGPAFAAWMATASCFSSRCQLRELRLYPIGTTGNAVPAPPYAQGSPITLRWKTPVAGGNSGAAVPPQLSVVASHLTQQVGRRGRGRAFLPPVTATSLNEGGLSSSVATALLGAQRTLLGALAVNSGVGPWSASTRPSIIGSPWNQYAVINTVRIGNVIDTQRRRRRSATEAFISGAVTY